MSGAFIPIFSAKKLKKKYKEIENSVIGTYNKIENAVVESYTKTEYKFVSSFLQKEGETLEETKKRLQQEIKKTEI